jgi:hypothetical protein
MAITPHDVVDDVQRIIANLTNEDFRAYFLISNCLSHLAEMTALSEFPKTLVRKLGGFSDR